MQREKTTLSVRHLTTYRYAQPVELGEHRMMLRPRDGHDQRLDRFELTIEPRPSRIRWLYDAFDNCVALASFAGATTSLRFESAFTVDRTEDEQPGGEIDPRARHYPFAYLPEELPDVSRSIERIYPDPGGDLERWAGQFVNSGGATLTGHLLMTMTYAIKEGFAYERREEAGRAAALGDARPAEGQLPGFCGADDGGRARRWASPPGSCPVTSTAPAPTRAPDAWAAARLTPGSRSTFRAPGGSNSTRPTA